MLVVSPIKECAECGPNSDRSLLIDSSCGQIPTDRASMLLLSPINHASEGRANRDRPCVSNDLVSRFCTIEPLIVAVVAY